MARQNKLKGNIRKFYLLQIFAGLGFFVPVIVLFWQDNGLSLTQITLLQSAFSITIVLLNIPTGYFADVFGRKKSLAIGACFWSLGIFTYILGHNFYEFLIAEILWATGTSFFSGADSAFMYDTLKDMGQEKNYKKIWGNSKFFYLISMALASIMGGFIGKFNFRWVFYVTLPFMILLIPLSLFLHEPKKHKIVFKKQYASELLRTIRFELLKNHKLRWLVAYSAVIFGFNLAAFFLYQPYFKLSGLDIFYFGFVFAAMNIVAAASSKYAHQIEEKLGQRYSLAILILLISAGFVLMSNFIFLFSFSFAFLHQFVRGFSDPVIKDYVNKLTKSKIRATVLSAQDLIGRLFFALMIPFIGLIADVYSITQALFVLGITAIAAGISILILLRKNKVI